MRKMKSTQVTLKEIIKNNSILSPIYYINKKQGKYPYVFKKDKYVRVSEYNLKGGEEFFTELQAKHINNLNYSIKEIKKEIERIKHSKDYDNEFNKSKSKKKK